MPVCKGCGKLFSGVLDFCPYCDLPKTGTMEKLGEWKICPACHQDDQVEKVTTIIRRHRMLQKSKVVGIDPVPARENLINRDPTEDLAKKLAAPKQPHPSNGSCFLSAVAFGPASVGFVLFGRSFFRPSTEGSNIMMLESMLFLGCAIILLLIAKPKRERYQSELNQFKKYILRWQKLFYCARCKQAFIPGEEISIPVDEVQDFIHLGNLHQQHQGTGDD
jgi:RNA polymerase subunit RPABC4/transcription elongation factor Spt4